MLRSARPAHRAGAARSPAVPRVSAPRTISSRPVAASAAPRRNYAASFVPISSKVPVTLAEGDGIGPEISNAVVHILKEAGAAVEFQKVEVGEKEYRRGHLSGIAGETWDTIRRNKVMLKGPITTPSGGGYKSLNVTMRKTLGLYANVRPCQSMHPFVATKHPIMDVVIVRENEEDLYAGIEHTQTNEVVQCLKLISRPGCEKICQYAFEYARRNGRKKVSCFVKDNIMKMTDGLFAKVFEETGAKYPEIQRDRWIVDIGAARLADTPEIFDVIVMPNLYGDILSDVAAQITGSVGLGGSVNLGDHGAIFEAIHGSAPMIAGKDVANPSGLLLSSVMLLNHIGQAKIAENVHNAWLRTMEEGVHTPDLFKPPHSRKQVGTQEFGRQVAARLGKKPEKLKAVNYSDTDTSMREWKPHLTTTHNSVKEIVGVDVFLHWNPRSGIQYQSAPDYLAGQISTVSGDGLDLLLVTNRGVKVWPGGFPETFCTDHWRLRFKAKNGKTVQHNQIISLLMRITNLGFDFIKMENLYTFDGAAGYSLAQGE